VNFRSLLEAFACVWCDMEQQVEEQETIKVGSGRVHDDREAKGVFGPVCSQRLWHGATWSSDSGVGCCARRARQQKSRLLFFVPFLTVSTQLISSEGHEFIV
jgi:hypothetical protein